VQCLTLRRHLLKTYVVGTLSASTEASTAPDEGITVIVSGGVLRPLLVSSVGILTIVSDCVLLPALLQAFKIKVPVQGIDQISAICMPPSFIIRATKTFEQSTDSSLVLRVYKCLCEHRYLRIVIHHSLCGVNRARL